MWKKQKEIVGVSDSTVISTSFATFELTFFPSSQLVDLRAALFEQEQLKRSRVDATDEAARKVKRVRLHAKESKEGGLGEGNKGVSDRARKDEIHSMSLDGPSLADAEAKLRVKADIYNRVEKSMENDEDLFLVDFESKRSERKNNVSELMALPVEQRARIANATLPSNWKTVEAYRSEAEYDLVKILNAFYSSLYLSELSVI
jgi:hypothetical protein